MYLQYDDRFRKQVIRYYEAHPCYEDTSRKYNVAINTIKRWQRRSKAEGHFENRKRKLYPEALKAYIRDHPKALHKEIANHFGCSEVTVNAVLKKYGITHSRRKTIAPKELEAYLQKNPGACTREIAAHFGCSVSYVNKIKRIYRIKL